MPEWESTNCPIWDTPAWRKVYSQNDFGTEFYLYDSPRTAGRFLITRNAANDFPGHRKFLGKQSLQFCIQFTDWLVDQRRLEVQEPKIYDNFHEFRAGRRQFTVAERIDRVLLNLATYFPGPGQQASYGDQARGQRSGPPNIKRELPSYIQAWSSDSDTVEDHLLSATVTYILDCLTNEGFVARTKLAPGLDTIVITPKGHARVDELRNKVVDSSQGFVAMWFDGSMTAAFENGIKPGIEDAGYRALRVDNKEHNDKIDDQIIAEIRRSRFIVADFTHGDEGARGGVYYEAGFAHGLGIPVIFTCREGGKVHFDTRQYNHIFWKDASDLRTRLSQRISATIGDGPHRR